MSADLPADLRRDLEALAEGKSRNAMAERAAALSQLYRAGRRTADAIGSADDALAYALVRMPATYAAATAVLTALAESWPDFAPDTLQDIGAGPGTATFAAARQFPALRHIHMIDADPHLRGLAQALLRASASAALRGASYEAGEIAAARRGGEPADLVIASYVVGELAPGRLTDMADALWSRTGGALVVIEPTSPPDLLHLERTRPPGSRAPTSRRLARTIAPARSSRRTGATSRSASAVRAIIARSRARRCRSRTRNSPTWRSPVIRVRARRPGAGWRIHAWTKGALSAKLCTDDGIVTEVTGRRDRDAYRLRTRWRWGDAVDRTGP